MLKADIDCDFDACGLLLGDDVDSFENEGPDVVGVLDRVMDPMFVNVGEIVIASVIVLVSVSSKVRVASVSVNVIDRVEMHAVGIFGAENGMQYAVVAPDAQMQDGFWDTQP